MKNIDDEKLYIYERDNYQCQICGNGNQSVLTQAHRLRQGKNSETVIKNYLTKNSIEGIKVKDILHHPLNICVACADPCNALIDISFNRLAVDVLLYNIIKDLKND